MLRASKCRLKGALKDRESFFEVVAMTGRSSTRRHVHIDQAKAVRRVFAGKKDGVGIADHAI
jgi:hypothetical protein